MLGGTAPAGLAHVPVAAVAMVLDVASTEIAVAAKTKLENLGCVGNTKAERDADVRLQTFLVRGPARDEVDAMLIRIQRGDVTVTRSFLVILDL